MRIFDLTESQEYPKVHHVLDYNIRHDIKDFDPIKLEYQIYKFWAGCRGLQAKNDLLLANYVQFVLNHVPVFLVNKSQIGEKYTIRETCSSFVDVIVPDNNVESIKIDEKDFIGDFNAIPRNIAIERTQKIVRIAIKNEVFKYNRHQEVPISLPQKEIEDIILDIIVELDLYSNPDDLFEQLYHLIKNRIYKDEKLREKLASKEFDDLIKEIIKHVIDLIFNSDDGKKIQPLIGRGLPKRGYPDIEANPDEDNIQHVRTDAAALYCPCGGDFKHVSDARLRDIMLVRSYDSNPQIFIYMDYFLDEMEEAQSAKYLNYTIAHEFAHAMMDAYLLHSFLCNKSQTFSTNVKYDSKDYIINEESLATSAGLHAMGNDIDIKVHINNHPLPYRYALSAKFQNIRDVQSILIPKWIEEKINLRKYGIC